MAVCFWFRLHRQVVRPFIFSSSSLREDRAVTRDPALQPSILVAVRTATVSQAFLSYLLVSDWFRLDWQKSETLLEKASPFLHSTGLEQIPVTAIGQ